MVTFAQPIVTLAPSAPLSLVVSNDNPAQLAMTTGGSAGAVTSVNGKAGAVTVAFLQDQAGNTVSVGSGAPSKPTGSNPLAGDYYYRTDTANQRLYVCTAGGATPTWVGLL